MHDDKNEISRKTIVDVDGDDDDDDDDNDIYIGGIVAKWLERRTCNSKALEFKSHSDLYWAGFALSSEVPSSDPRPCL